tara:strand:+ start:1215 stop:4283 length:3069 start_codon:yes stop_codon:yes gene_type:complete
MILDSPIITGSIIVSGSMQVEGQPAETMPSASYVETSQTASFVEVSQTSSYVLASNIDGIVANATSASYAITASYSLNSIAGTSGTSGASGTSGISGLAYTHTQTTSAITWTINHNLSSSLLNSTVTDANKNVIIPNQIDLSDDNTAVVTFLQNQAGFAIFSSLTGNPSGTSGISGLAYTHTQVSSATTWTINHNLSSSLLNVTVTDANKNVIVPLNIDLSDNNTAVVTFTENVAGFAIFSSLTGNFAGTSGTSGTTGTSGTSGTISAQTTVTSSFTNSVLIDVTHSFNSKNLLVAVYDTSDNQLTPEQVNLSNLNITTISLPATSSGYVVVAKGGHVVSGSSSSVSSSYAVSSSHALTASYIGGGLTDSGDLTVGGHILPDTTEIYDLGSSAARFRDIYLSGSTIDLGGTRISTDSEGDIEFKDSSNNLKKVRAAEMVFGSGASKKRMKLVSGKVVTTDDSGNVEHPATASYSFTSSISEKSVYTSEWVLGADGTNNYTFIGPGFTASINDPSIYLNRGQQYKFTNTMGAHPFRIQVDPNGSTGTQYNNGVSNNDVSNGTLNFNVPMGAPETLYYQCTSHASMGGPIYILDTTPATASFALTAGTALTASFLEGGGGISTLEEINTPGGGNDLTLALDKSTIQETVSSTYVNGGWLAFVKNSPTNTYSLEFSSPTAGSITMGIWAGTSHTGSSSYTYVDSTKTTDSEFGGASAGNISITQAVYDDLIVISAAAELPGAIKYTTIGGGPYSGTIITSTQIPDAIVELFAGSSIPLLPDVTHTELTGDLIVTGSGQLYATASYAITASHALTASYIEGGSGPSTIDVGTNPGGEKDFSTALDKATLATTAGGSGVPVGVVAWARKETSPYGSISHSLIWASDQAGWTTIFVWNGSDHTGTHTLLNRDEFTGTGTGFSESTIGSSGLSSAEYNTLVAMGGASVNATISVGRGQYQYLVGTEIPIANIEIFNSYVASIPITVASTVTNVSSSMDVSGSLIIDNELTIGSTTITEAQLISLLATLP